jgi:hypothetical protein
MSELENKNEVETEEFTDRRSARPGGGRGQVVRSEVRLRYDLRRTSRLTVPAVNR